MPGNLSRLPGERAAANTAIEVSASRPIGVHQIVIGTRSPHRNIGS